MTFSLSGGREPDLSFAIVLSLNYRAPKVRFLVTYTAFFAAFKTDWIGALKERSPQTAQIREFEP